MDAINPITKTNLSIPSVSRGKVRDVYELDNNLLMVSSDRLSAFDVVFNDGIPLKGQVLNSLSVFWFLKTNDIIRNHFITDAIPANLPKYLNGRSMIVLRAKPIKLECVVRGYLTGSGLKEYEKTGSVCGIPLPKGLKNGSELPHPIFTPTTKAEQGHDLSVTEQQAKELVGETAFNFIREKSIHLYEFGRNHARKCGLVLADTKFEFGYHQIGKNTVPVGHEQIADRSGEHFSNFEKSNLSNGNGTGAVGTGNGGHNGNGMANTSNIILIDEILTPDSSRYWLKNKYDEGVLESLDKQFVRDYLERIGWNKSPPAPVLPKDVIENTTKRYLQAYKMLTGRELGVADTLSSLEA